MFGAQVVTFGGDLRTMTGLTVFRCDSTRQGHNRTVTQYAMAGRMDNNDGGAAVNPTEDTACQKAILNKQLSYSPTFF